MKLAENQNKPVHLTKQVHPCMHHDGQYLLTLSMPHGPAQSQRRQPVQSYMAMGLRSGREWSHSYNNSTAVIYSVLLTSSARYLSAFILTEWVLIEKKSREQGLFIWLNWTITCLLFGACFGVSNDDSCALNWSGRAWIGKRGLWREAWSLMSSSFFLF